MDAVKLDHLGWSLRKLQADTEVGHDAFHHHRALHVRQVGLRVAEATLRPRDEP
jgi:hypothetical protein